MFPKALGVSAQRGGGRVPWQPGSFKSLPHGWCRWSWGFRTAGPTWARAAILESSCSKKAVNLTRLQSTKHLQLKFFFLCFLPSLAF